MKLKRFAVSLLAAVLLCTSVHASGPVVTPFAETGQRLVCGGEEQRVSAYNLDGNNYFKLRDIAALLGARVFWDEASRTIELAAAGELSFSPLRNPELNFGIAEGSGEEYMLCDFCFTPEGTLLLLQLDGCIFEYGLDGALLGSYDLGLAEQGLTAFRVAAGAEGRLALLDGHNNAIISATREGVEDVGPVADGPGPDDVGLIEAFEFNSGGDIHITWSDMNYGYAADVAVEDGAVALVKSYPNMGRRVPGGYGITVTSPVATLGTKKLYVDIFSGEKLIDSFTINVEREGLAATAFVLHGVTEGAYFAQLMYLENNRFKSRWVLVGREGSTRGIMALESELTGGESLRYLGTELWYARRSGDYLRVAPLSSALGSAFPWVGDYSVTATETAASSSSQKLVIYPFAQTGQRLVCGGEEKKVSAYNINGNNYFKLRDIAEILGAQVFWDEDSKTIELTAGALGH